MGKDNVVQLLLERGDIDVNQADKDGVAPLQVAAGIGHDNIVRLLLERPDIKINQANKFGFTALYMAANDGNVRSVELLVGHEDIHLTKGCKNGFTPLSIALRRKNLEGEGKFDEVVSLLKEGIRRPKNETSTCIVCMDRRPEVVLVPCGHQDMCGPCAYQWGYQCPVDRIRISEILPLAENSLGTNNQLQEDPSS